MYEENLICGYRDTSNQKGLTQNFDVKVDEFRDARTNEQTMLQNYKTPDILSMYVGGIKKRL